MCPYRAGVALKTAGTETVNRNLSTLERDPTMSKFSAFLKDEAGAVTVDWVVLTAAVVGLGLVVMVYIRPAVSGLASDIADEIEDAGSKMQATN